MAGLDSRADMLRRGYTTRYHWLDFLNARSHMCKTSLLFSFFHIDIEKKTEKKNGKKFTVAIKEVVDNPNATK